ncbi:hypothetical protein JYB64_07045 [Algoriphagus aestuarii]|nr:hypothetical protein [Algoriphagus aestuarii]
MPRFFEWWVYTTVYCLVLADKFLIGTKSGFSPWIKKMVDFPMQNATYKKEKNKRISTFQADLNASFSKTYLLSWLESLGYKFLIYQMWEFLEWWKLD